MNTKVLSVLMVLVLVNTCIGLPVNDLVNESQSTQLYTDVNNKVADGYYETCVWACVNGVCARKCW